MSASLTVKSNLYDAIKRNTDNSEDVIFARHKYSPEFLTRRETASRALSKPVARFNFM